MKVAVFGGSGSIGRSIVKEALDRGHEVTVVARNPSRLDLRHEHLSLTTADVTRSDEVAGAVDAHDAVVSAVGVTEKGKESFLIDAARGLIEGARRSGVKRLVVVGGA